MKHRTLWLLGGAVAAFAAYELWFAPGHVPAGFTRIAVAPSVTLALKAPANGNIAFVLPSGSKWINAARTFSPGAAQTEMQFQSTNGPLLASAATPGQGFMLSWSDSNGAQQVAVYTLA